MAKQFALLAAALLAALPAESQNPAPAPQPPAAPLQVPEEAPAAPKATAPAPAEPAPAKPAPAQPAPEQPASPPTPAAAAPVPLAPAPAPFAFAMGYALEALSAAVGPGIEVALGDPIPAAAKPGPPVVAKPAPKPPTAKLPGSAPGTLKPGTPVAAAPKPAAPRPAPKPAEPKPAEPKAPVETTSTPLVRGPINVLSLMRTGRVKVSHSRLDAGTPDLVFDGNRHTFARAQGPTTAAAAQGVVPGGGTGYWQVVLDRPRLIDEVNVAFTPSVQHNWALFGADTEADMEARKGSFKQLFQPRVPQFEGRDQVTFPSTRPYRVYRVECKRLAGEGGPELAEWSLWTPQQLARLEVESFVQNVVVGQKIQLRSEAIYEAGAQQNMTPEVKWEVAPPAAGVVDELGRFEGKLPGTARVFAVHGNRRSEPMAVEVMAQGQPDWTVSYIERQPRLHHADGAAGPEVGQTVYWFAHVRNYGTSNSEPVAVEWRLDGKVIRSGSLPKLERFSQTEIILGLPWDGAPHTLELVVDPQGEVAETSEANNRLAVRTDALSVGFWVEDSTLRYFHRHQKDLGVGSNSFEDWAQRQVQFWNSEAEKATDPKEKARRFRLDRIIVVGDGMLPMAGGSPILDPDRRDDTVQVAVGVPAYNRTANNPYSRTAEKAAGNPFYIQTSLLDVALGRGNAPTTVKTEAVAK